MNLLAIDTATEACSAALSVKDNISNLFEVCPQQHSQRLLPMVDSLLQQANVSLQNLDVLGFGRGPGSFTGVRIATAMLQGLALGAELKCAGISTMATMAQQAIEQCSAQDIVVTIDARMGEVYFAHYKNAEGVATLVGQEAVLSPQTAASLLPTRAFHSVGTGWQSYAQELACENMTGTDILYPDARFMIALVQQAVNNGDICDVEQVEPSYVRDTVTWKKLPGRE
ncbi:tRNA (adenosine(37)-N6)-threonylcarbamoyltransferase complex dimerization subunit type 1 TsaB [Aestuariibacter salexigens]|uniref:tRNA (adenosine(37)-N6)-threonylcarbamoyltransferase complex dimerization subunit type 1 TsaB n=1 Tax=Aestuariibacter salexigens TaxID=226010 RepID=UPI00040F16F5|nr:tRNA (adenosine(37)-N6)-threonylcarbamoyltransferase complex dimerization subunit type 1 TsaB [Aestuariibacter salexigens]